MKKKPTICMTTYFDKNFAKIGNLCLEGIKKYAKKHGYDVKLYNNIYSNRPPAWNKMLVVQKLLEDPKKYDFIFWIDSDTLFTRFDEDIAKEIEPDKDFYLSRIDYTGEEIPITAVFLIRNNEWSRNFFKEAWEMKKYIYHNWWEQAAINDLLGYKHTVEYNKHKVLLTKFLYKIKCKHLATKIFKKIRLHTYVYNLFSPKKTENSTTTTNNLKNNSEYAKKTKWLDKKWDDLPVQDPKHAANPIIIHFPSLPLKIRESIMIEIAELQKSKEFEKISKKKKRRKIDEIVKKHMSPPQLKANFKKNLQSTYLSFIK